MGLGKMIVIGCIAPLFAAQAQAVVACASDVAKPLSEIVRKPVKPVERDRMRIERRAAFQTMPSARSRRIILQ